jgi:Tfp pilus assembly protein PilN
MSIYPNLEARISALERRQIHTDTRIEEVAQDMTASFGQLSEYLMKIEENNEKRFHAIETVLNDHTRLLNDHTRLLNDHTKILNDHTKLLNQILARLPENH